MSQEISPTSLIEQYLEEFQDHKRVLATTFEQLVDRLITAVVATAKDVDEHFISTHRSKLYELGEALRTTTPTWCIPMPGGDHIIPASVDELDNPDEEIKISLHGPGEVIGAMKILSVIPSILSHYAEQAMGLERDQAEELTVLFLIKLNELLEEISDDLGGVYLPLIQIALDSQPTDADKMRAQRRLARALGEALIRVASQY